MPSIGSCATSSGSTSAWTMIIYEPLNAYDYECINCDDEDDYEIFNEFDGTPRHETWQPINVNLGPADQGQAGLLSDFPWLTSAVLIMRKRAVDALHDILHVNGELLPLIADNGVELFAFNARTIDALDEVNASIMRFPDSNQIMYIRQTAFIAHRIRGVDIFRLPHRASPTYVSARFVERVKQAELVGLEFNAVWSSE